MTQAIANTVNNMEQLLSGNEKKVAKTVESSIPTMDKRTNFGDVLKTKIEPKKSTISDIKNDNIDTSPKNADNEIDLNTDINTDVNTDTLADFQKILKKVTEETNVESSLDLTLAKNIGEIISQLKEAIEETTELVENNNENLDSELSINIGSLVDSEDENANLELNLSMQDYVSLPEEDSEQENADFKEGNEQKISFEQVLTFVDNKVIDTPDIKNIKEDSNLNLVDNNQEQTELIEFAENIVNKNLATELPKKVESEVENIDLNIDEEILKDLKIESISAQSDFSEGQNLMQNQTAEEHSVKVMINQEIEGSFEIKLDSGLNTEQLTQSVPTKPTEMSPARLIDQITKHFENLHTNSKVNLVLNPESLGKVNIQLMTTKEGLTAQFTVTTQEARDLLMKGLDGLKETLASHGVGVDNVSVKVADSQKAEYNQDWTEQDSSNGGNKERKNPDREEKEKGLFERMMAQVNEQEENGNV